MGDEWNKGYFSSGPQRTYEAQQAQHYRREQERARADEQRRADERRRREEVIQAERASAAELRRTTEWTRTSDRPSGRRVRLVSVSPPTKSPWAWGAVAFGVVWWISATVIALGLEKMGVGQALAMKIGVWTLPTLVAVALAAGICWITWSLLKAIWTVYLAHRRFVHIVAVFVLLLASVQLGLVGLLELAGFNAVGIGTKVFAANVPTSALATWLVMRKLPAFFR